jgi:hypothetical protein
MASAKGARIGAMWGADRLQEGEARMLGELSTGYDAAKGYLQQGQSRFDPLAQSAGVADTMYSNALGLNGTTGTQAAQGAFQTSPGYGFQLDQGLQALMRKRAAGGQLASGNADADTLRYSQGLASGEWGGWLDRLGNLGNRGLAIAGAQSAYDRDQANLASGYYGNRVGLMKETLGDVVGLGVGALKAGDAAKTANQNMMLGGLNTAASLAGSIFSGAMGGMGGAGGAVGAGNAPRGGFMNFFGG